MSGSATSTDSPGPAAPTIPQLPSIEVKYLNNDFPGYQFVGQGQYQGQYQDAATSKVAEEVTSFKQVLQPPPLRRNEFSAPSSLEGTPEPQLPSNLNSTNLKQEVGHRRMSHIERAVTPEANDIIEVAPAVTRSPKSPSKFVSVDIPTPPRRQNTFTTINNNTVDPSRDPRRRSKTPLASMISKPEASGTAVPALPQKRAYDTGKDNVATPGAQTESTAEPPKKVRKVTKEAAAITGAGTADLDELPIKMRKVVKEAAGGSSEKISDGEVGVKATKEQATKEAAAASTVPTNPITAPSATGALPTVVKSIALPTNPDVQAMLDQALPTYTQASASHLNTLKASQDSYLATLTAHFSTQADQISTVLATHSKANATFQSTNKSLESQLTTLRAEYNTLELQRVHTAEERDEIKAAKATADRKSEESDAATAQKLKTLEAENEELEGKVKELEMQVEEKSKKLEGITAALGLKF